MPWYLSLLITLALKFGVPWLLDHIPGIPEEVKQIIKDLLEKLKGHKEEKKALVREAKAQIRSCTVGCPPELVN